MLIEQSRRSKITILVDENANALKKPLKDLGFKVISFNSGMKDEQLWELAEGTAILTANTKDFTVAAVVHDFDIIDISNVKFMDNKQDSQNETALVIAKSIRESQFYNKRGNWLLQILANKTWTLRELI